MPRYYCDYCDTYLTHDSPSVRKQHNAGYKHKANVRTYYQQFEEQQTQSLIDQKVKEHLGQAGYQQVGAAFHQHMTALGGQYRPPIPLPLPLRPLVMPRPAVPAPGYVMPPGMRPHGADANGLPQPPTLTPPGAPPGSFPSSVSNNPMPSAPGAPLSNGSYANAPPVSGPPVNYPQNSAPPSANTQYSAQQSFRTMASSGQPSGPYNQGQPNAPGGYSGAQPTIQNYNS